jgi:threonine dehydrogenase-like Zn-dependent dehydrogenase
MTVGVRAATMEAAVLTAPSAPRVAQVAVPEPAEGEVLVRVEGCGVCASSLPLWEGRPWFSYPLPPGAPGHEAWGRLDDATRVVFLGERGYAQWAVAATDVLVPVPAALDGLPFPGEALGCAVMIFRRARVRADERVAIVGAGFLGSAVAQLCVRAGAEVVVVRRTTPVESLRDSCECAIETGGVQETLDAAAAVLTVGGRLVIAGYHQDGARSIDLGSWNWRALELANAHERDEAKLVEAMREAAELAAAGVLDVERLVTHRFPLARIGDAFEAARTRPDGFVKAWVEP